MEIRAGGSCVESCPANEHEVNRRCACAEGTFEDAVTGECTLISECAHVAKYDDGRQVCMQTETC